LATPSLYENAGPDVSTEGYGQSFVSDGQFIVGIDVYIQDATRPDEFSVNELVGPAEMRLYQMAEALLADPTPSLLASSQIAEPGEILSGLVSLDFNELIPTTPGAAYAFVFVADDSFGLGMRAQFSSTYAEGSEVYRTTDGVITPFSGRANFRDVSFAVRGVEAIPEPPTYVALLTGIGLIAYRRRKRLWLAERR
jgi:hypothetical protein